MITNMSTTPNDKYLENTSNDWDNYTEDEILEYIDTLLYYGSFINAREMSVLGVKKYPNSFLLQKYARILAPPTTRKVYKEVRPDIRKNNEWFRLHRNEYRNKWIALLDGELLGSANTLDMLISITGDVKNTGILITQVF